MWQLQAGLMECIVRRIDGFGWIMDEALINGSPQQRHPIILYLIPGGKQMTN